MTKDLYRILQRELYIVKYGQDRSFRIKKWIVIGIIMFIISLVYGWVGVVRFIVSFTFFGIFVHFIFRYKTKRWTRPWWIMKNVIKTPFD